METYTEDQRQRAFGFHLMLDCYGCAGTHLDDIGFCYTFLDDLVDRIGAIKQTQPYVFRTPEEFEGKEGLSGWVPIVESGISLHTLTETGFITLDVYSCREFDREVILQCVQEAFSPDDIEVRYLLRGLKYHAHRDMHTEGRA